MGVTMNSLKWGIGFIAVMAGFGLTACGSDSGTSSNGEGAGGDSAGASCQVSIVPCPDVLEPNTICDARDGKIYKTATIGTQIWLAQNLDYCTSGSWCYDNNQANCDKYGRLYTWSSAMGLSSSFNATEANPAIPAQGICPEGFHVPTTDEWDALGEFAASATGSDNNSLRSVDSWTSSMSTPGSDDFGFAAYGSGRYYMNNFADLGFKAYFWTSEEDNTPELGDPVRHSLIRSLSGMIDAMGFGNSNKADGLSLRCVK